MRVSMPWTYLFIVIWIIAYGITNNTKREMLTTLAVIFALIVIAPSFFYYRKRSRQLSVTRRRVLARLSEEPHSPEALKLAFEFFDKDKNGRLCTGEVREMLMALFPTLKVAKIRQIERESGWNRRKDIGVTVTEFEARIDELMRLTAEQPEIAEVNQVAIGIDRLGSSLGDSLRSMVGAGA